LAFFLLVSFVSHGFLVSIRLVLVAVVAQVLRRLAFLVQAIRARRCPGHLERKHEQQQNEEEFTHGDGYCTERSA
ncbi:MAG: hypothetical protein RSE46_07025, partial [Janthinobacterium sp.]